MSLSPSAVIRHGERVAARVVDGAALVVVLDKRELHRLNRVGSRIWQVCDGRTVDQVCELLTAEFGLDRTRAEADLAAFVEQLVGVGALRLEGAQPGERTAGTEPAGTEKP